MGKTQKEGIGIKAMVKAQKERVGIKAMGKTKMEKLPLYEYMIIKALSSSSSSSSDSTSTTRRSQGFISDYILSVYPELEQHDDHTTLLRQQLQELTQRKIISLAINVQDPSDNHYILEENVYYPIISEERPTIMYPKLVQDDEQGGREGKEDKEDKKEKEEEKREEEEEDEVREDEYMEEDEAGKDEGEEEEEDEVRKDEYMEEDEAGKDGGEEEEEEEDKVREEEYLGDDEAGIDEEKNEGDEDEAKKEGDDEGTDDFMLQLEVPMIKHILEIKKAAVDAADADLDAEQAIVAELEADLKFRRTVLDRKTTIWRKRMREMAVLEIMLEEREAAAEEEDDHDQDNEEEEEEVDGDKDNNEDQDEPSS